MSNTGIRGFYLLTETIEQQLLSDVNVNTVTTGDIYDIDLSKMSIFPLAHIIINNVISQESVLTFNISVLAMDVVDESKKATTDVFRGNNDEQDILNTQLQVVNKLVKVLRKGNLYNDQFQLDGDANCEPFYERFSNKLAGWSATFNVFVARQSSRPNLWPVFMLRSKRWRTPSRPCRFRVETQRAAKQNCAPDRPCPP